jgi:hypothetical protein
LRVVEAAGGPAVDRIARTYARGLRTFEVMLSRIVLKDVSLCDYVDRWLLGHDVPEESGA